MLLGFQPSYELIVTLLAAAVSAFLQLFAVCRICHVDALGLTARTATEPR